MAKTWSVIFLIAAMTCLAAGKPEVNVSGTWTGQITAKDGGRGTVRFVLRQAGEKISGTAGPTDKREPPQIYDGKLQEGHLTFAADDTDESGLKLIYHFDLTATDDRIEGKAHGRSGDRSWTVDVSVTRDK